MLVENSFHYLPEILCGSNYGAQHYEASIVNAMSLALLQELNARNVPNPLASLTVEKLYSISGFSRPDDAARRRYLRADLYVDTSRTFAATKALSRFGWRHRNYLEAKFFRKGPSTVNAALLLGDLVRLCVLTPPEVAARGARSPAGDEDAPDGKYSGLCVGRYLLHVYKGEPEELVGKRTRKWLKSLRNPGSHSASVKIGDDKAKTFKETLSTALNELKLEVRVTNTVLRQSGLAPTFHCVLTRVDSFKVSLAHDWYEEKDDRTAEESAPGVWKTLCNTVGSNVLYAATKATVEAEAEETPPSEAETELFQLAAQQDTEVEDAPADDAAGPQENI